MKKFSFMSKIKLNNAPKRMLLLKQLSLLLCTVFIFIVAVFAWFTGSDSAKNATVTGIQVTMEGSNNLLISLDGGTNFLPGIDLMNKEHQENYISSGNSIENLFMMDITSDGKTFYRPVFLDEDSSNNKTPDPSQGWDFAGETTYISEDIVFRTAVPSKIYLGSGTTITTTAEEDGKLLSNTTKDGIGNKSAFGNFSLDCIVGALRISAVNSNNELVFVYIPRKDIEMTKTITDGVTKYEVKTGIENVSDNTSVHTYYKSISTTSAPYFELAESSKVVPDLVTNPSPIAETTLQSNGYYEATATVNIWLEGCDPETTRALSRGQYKISLDFTATETAQ